MASFTFPQLAYEAYSKEPARWREDGHLEDLEGNTVTTTDMNGVPGPLRTGATGIVESFKADVESGRAVFGDGSRTLIFSDEWLLMRERMGDLVAAAQQAAADANAALAKATPVSYVGRDPDGRLFAQSTPIDVGGGTPIWEGGRLAFVFPTYL